MDKELPLISIIIPTYNASITIANCLKSIESQTYKDFEVIVIDGDSRDDTINILKEHTDNNLNFKYISQKDHGVYDAMNTGLNLARGEYLYFLGSDDTLYNDEVLSDIASQLVSAKPEIMYGNVRICGNNQFVKDGLIHAGEFDLKRLVSENICHQSIFYHNTVFKQIGGYQLKYPVMADHDLNLRAYAKFKFVHTDIIIANFAVGGISSQIVDTRFEKEKDANFIKYFFKKLHTKPFMYLRLYVQRAAFSPAINISLAAKIYCMLVYFKLKVHSLFK